MQESAATLARGGAGKGEVPRPPPRPPAEIPANHAPRRADYINKRSSKSFCITAHGPPVLYSELSIHPQLYSYCALTATARHTLRGLEVIAPQAMHTHTARRARSVAAQEADFDEHRFDARTNQRVRRARPAWGLMGAP